jgi:hypothetical protein
MKKVEYFCRFRFIGQRTTLYNAPAMEKEPSRKTAIVQWMILHFVAVVLLSAVALGQATAQEMSDVCSEQAKAKLKIQISVTAALAVKPITGRVFVILARKSSPEPRLQIGWWNQRVPFFGADVDQLKPGQPAIIDANTLGFPFKSLCELQASDYYAQALLNVYTEFHRSDGHTIWAHMDQWEGQQFNKSPGNLYSEVQTVHLDPSQGYDLKLSLTKSIPPVQTPPDTAQVKHIKIQSTLLTQFWGQPFYVGATVLLPKGYGSHPQVRYPVIYVQDHFTLDPPFQYRADQLSDDGVSHDQGMSGYQFHRQWDSASFPRMIAVVFQHPTPYFDDSYAVNSANNGPYGDALLTELIPYLEKHFRIIRKPYARMLTGGSTGGWESLALQVFHSEFFGGTWTFFPDPIDFTRYQLVDIYRNASAFLVPGFDPPVPERPLERTVEGQVVFTMREMSQMEAVLGSHGRSGQQLEAWEAVYGPVGDDGYPKPLWDKLSGEIDRSVAEYMRDHGYDLRYYLQQNWGRIGRQLVGKIHIYCGDMDNYYLNLAVYRMEEFLSHTKNPYYAGSFEYGRPMKGHGWKPMNNAQLVRRMADTVSKHAPKGETTNAWHYK